MWWGDVRLAAPWALLIPVFALVLFLLRKRHYERPLLPDTEPFAQIRPSWRVTLRTPVLAPLALLALITLTVASARPQRVSFSEGAKLRNLILCLDVSKSMEAIDFFDGVRPMQRLDGVKEVVSDFVAARKDDRIGLVVFGGQAFLQIPLTRDHSLVSQMVSALRPGMAGDGTAIGDGLGVSLRRIENILGDAKAIVLLTDGVNNAGKVDPLQAAKVARDLGVKVHTIGIGGGVLSRGAGVFDLLPGVRAEFDEKLLKEIAESKGGVYFNASSKSDLTRVYEEIDVLQAAELKDSREEIVEELFGPWLAAALAAYTLFLLFSRSVFMKVP